MPSHGRPERGVVAGGDLQQSTPVFFLAPQKENGGGAVKKMPVAVQLRARSAPCRAAGRGPKRSCSVKVIPTRTRAGLLAGYRTWYAVLHNSLVGQNLNLISFSFRAQSAASAVDEASRTYP